MLSFVVVSLLRDRHQTPVVKRSVNPVYAAKDATFDFPIYISLADRLGVVEFVIWDKDMLKKDYLGEANIPLEDWFRDENAFSFDDIHNRVVIACCTKCHSYSTQLVPLSPSLHPSCPRAIPLRQVVQSKSSSVSCLRPTRRRLWTTVNSTQSSSSGLDQVSSRHPR